MDPRLRTILIGLLSLAAVLVIYLLYSQASKAPHADIDIEATSVDEAAQSNVDDVNAEIGKIGDVGISALSKPVFRHLSGGRVDREFGFEELLHEEKNEWEVEKPYLNIYQSNFRCSVTANKGKIRIETAVDRSSPKEATFLGNVVIHILPEAGSDINESFLYLDDVVFVGEKSLLSTAGPIRFVSRDAQMLGTGFELIYNDQLERLELFRIIHLAKLLFKGSWATFLAQTKPADKTPAKSIINDDTQKPIEMSATIQENIEQRRGEYYKCVLSKNVIIDSPEQLVFAEDKVSINNIFWSRASEGEPIVQSGGSRQAETGTIGADEVTVSTAATLNHNEPCEPTEESSDFVVTCEGDLVIMPMNPTGLQDGTEKLGIEAHQERISDKGRQLASPQVRGLKDNTTGRTTFFTKAIDYDLSTGDAVAPGRSELTFYTSSLTDANNEETPAPIKITTQKEAKFLSAEKQVIFEGDCQCSMSRTGLNNIQQKYTLSAPKLMANLTAEDPNNKSRIEYLTADGGPVELKSIKTVDGKSIGGIKLDCFKIECDVGRQLFTATGPGKIELNNSNVPEPNEQVVGKFSFRRPCFAFVRDFAVLKYLQKYNRIIADSGAEGSLQIDYFPIVEGKSGQRLIVTADHLEAVLVQTSDGQSELSTLAASGGITYKEDDENEFLGSKLFFNREKYILKVEGDETTPCYFNGALVESVVYDLKTGRVEVPLTAPGTLKIK